MQSETPSLEYRAILQWIRQGSSVLDLGCGDGALLDLLVRERSVKAQGIEIDEQAIYQCVAKGLSVFHEDIDHGLSDYADQSFDYVILNQSFQQVKKPDLVLKEALESRERSDRLDSLILPIIQARLQIFLKGKTPVTPSLPYEWHDTPNLHFLSISDFIEYCRQRNIKLEKAAFVGKKRRITIFPNLFALTGIFLISNREANDMDQ